MKRILELLGAATAVAFIFGSALPQAAACGGFFCNRDEIDQAGERILFSYEEDGSITTIVQIQYTGPSEEFAWILPTPQLPTVGVGTDALFRQLEQVTAPRFEMDYEVLGECRRIDCPDDFGLAGGGAEFGGADAGASPPVNADEERGVTVHTREEVGPYDVAVLEATDVEVLRTWLNDNDFILEDEAISELDHYISLNHYFVVLKLLKSRDAGEIQPVVLRSTNDEPCIPVRLTRIAAVPNMPVVAYFAADRRARPTNYLLVNGDYEDPGLWMSTTPYADMVTRVTDDAGGNAFVTDFAGDVPSLSLRLESIESLRTETDPGNFLSVLRDRGFNGDSQLLGVLARFIPAPSGTDEQDFYNCLTNSWCDRYDEYVRTLSFSPDALVDALNEQIVTPREEAQAILDAHTHLTRLFTTLSPEEMTLDPQFMLSPDLPREFSNRHEATLQIECSADYLEWSAPRYMLLPSGSRVLVSEGTPYMGTDDELCADYGSGAFSPWTPEERLAETSRMRSMEGAGGAICSVQTPTQTGGIALVALLAATAVLIRRRRR